MLLLFMFQFLVFRSRYFSNSSLGLILDNREDLFLLYFWAFLFLSHFSTIPVPDYYFAYGCKGSRREVLWYTFDLKIFRYIGWIFILLIIAKLLIPNAYRQLTLPKKKKQLLCFMVPQISFWFVHMFWRSYA